MKPTMVKKSLVLLSILMVVTASAFGQSYKNRSRAHQSKRPVARANAGTYAPRVLNYSATSIIEGRVLLMESGLITIKSAGGERHQFLIDGATSVFESGELVSIATMGDITLKPSNLKPSDLVEIVVERAGRSSVARIITRVERAPAQTAKR